MEHEKNLFCAVKTKEEANDVLQHSRFPNTHGIIGEGIYFFTDKKKVRHF